MALGAGGGHGARAGAFGLGPSGNGFNGALRAVGKVGLE